MNKQQLNITCGTDVVLHDRLEFDGEVFGPSLSVDIVANLVNSLGKRTTLEVEVVDDYLVIDVPWVDGRNAGCYGLEVKGVCNERKWSTYADALIRYTRATVEGAAEVEVESDYYDITQIVGYRYTDSPIRHVTVEVDDNYGEPEATTTYDGRDLDIDFKNLKGNGIASVEQTIVSTEDEGVNETVITQDNGNTTVIQVRNGSKGNKGDKGDTGDSAIFDPNTGNISEMKQATGNSIVSPMSQKAVTDELDKLSLVPLADYTDIGIKNCYINGSNVYKTNTANYSGANIQNDITIALRGKIMRVTPQEGKSYCIAFTTNKPVNNDSALYSGTTGYNSRIFGDTVGMYIVPSDANYIYVQKMSGSGNDIFPLKIEFFERENVSDALDTSEGERLYVDDKLSELIGAEDITSQFAFTASKFICARKAESIQTQVIGTAYTSSSSAIQCTDGYIDISRFSKLRIAIVNSTADNLISGLCFYDSSKNVVGSVCRHSSSVNDNVVEYVDVPVNAQYVRTTMTTAGSTSFVCYGVPKVADGLNSVERNIESLKSAVGSTELFPTMNWKDWHIGWTFDISRQKFIEYTGTGKTNTRSLYIIPNKYPLAGKKVRINFDSDKYRLTFAEFGDEYIYIDSTGLVRLDSPVWQAESYDYIIPQSCKSAAIIIKKADDSAFTSVDDGDVELIFDDINIEMEEESYDPHMVDWKMLTYYDANDASWGAPSRNYRWSCIIPRYVVGGSHIHINMNSGYNYVIHEFETYDLALGYNAHVHHLYQGGWLAGENTINLQSNCGVVAIIVRKDNDNNLTVKNVVDNMTELSITTDDVYCKQVHQSGAYYGEKISLRHAYGRDALYELEMNSSYSYLSAFDVYGDYLVAVYPEFISGGSAASSCMGTIYNRKTREKICDVTFPLGSYAIPHANGACFGVEFASGNTDFPLFYISQWNKAGGVLVYNIIKDSDNEFHAELVQAIMPDTGIDESIFGVKVRGDWVVDKDNGVLYSVRYKYDSSFTPVSGRPNNTMVTKFALPKLSDGELVTLYTDNILDSFILPPTPVMQDKCMDNGKIYQLCGLVGSEAPNSQKIYVIDVERKSIVSVVDLTQYGQEPECLCVDGDSLLYTYFPGSSLFRLRFD